MASNFSSIPILDFSEAQSPTTREKFLSDLRHALVNVGFFYLTNHSIPEGLQSELGEKATQFFDLPLDTKLEIEMLHSKHYFGYVRVGNEFSGPNADYRESFTVCACACGEFCYRGQPDMLIHWLSFLLAWNGKSRPGA